MSKETKARPEITDEWIRAQDTVTSHEAAQYLGMSWWTLTELLRQGKLSCGRARLCPALRHGGGEKRGARLCPGGTWSYTIWGEKLYKFKHGEDTDDVVAQLREIYRQQEEINQKLAAVLEKLEGGAA